MLLTHKPQDAQPLMSQGLCACKSAQNLWKKLGPGIPAITQPLPWMSLLCCCVSNAGERLWDHEKPSLEVAASWGRPGRKRQDQTYVQVLGGCSVSPGQQCCPTIAAVVTPRPSGPASPGAGLILFFFIIIFYDFLFFLTSLLEYNCFTMVC